MKKWIFPPVLSLFFGMLLLAPPLVGTLMADTALSKAAAQILFFLYFSLPIFAVFFLLAFPVFYRWYGKKLLAGEKRGIFWVFYAAFFPCPILFFLLFGNLLLAILTTCALFAWCVLFALWGFLPQRKLLLKMPPSAEENDGHLGDPSRKREWKN